MLVFVLPFPCLKDPSIVGALKYWGRGSIIVFPTSMWDAVLGAEHTHA